MAANYNRSILMGNLTKDPELRYIPNGSAVVNLRMAINRTYKSQSGELKEEVTYVSVVVWGKQAENCAEYLAKGSPVFVEGRLQSRQWETEDGQKRSVLEVVADRVQFLARKKSGEGESPALAGTHGLEEAASVPAVTEDDIPF